MTLFAYIKTDYKKYKKYGGNFFIIVFFTQGFWAVFQYRIASFFYKKIKIKPFKILVQLFFLPWQKTIEILTGISIPASARIGKSFYIGHFGGIILNSKTVIGDNCNISQGVTIGISGIDENRGVPIIGDNVYIGANAVVAGKIFIGNNVLIGACSLVNKSLPDFSIAGGVPAKIISHKGSIGYI